MFVVDYVMIQLSEPIESLLWRSNVKRLFVACFFSSFMPAIPDLPGELVPHNSETERWLKAHVARLCQLDHDR